MDDLDMRVGDPGRDLRALFDASPVESLVRLDEAFAKGLVITRRYSDGMGRGCLLHFLTDGRIGTKHSLLQYDFGTDPDVQTAARRVIRHWDSGALTAPQVRTLLSEVIAARREANALENAAVERAGRFAWLRLGRSAHASCAD